MKFLITFKNQFPIIFTGALATIIFNRICNREILFRRDFGSILVPFRKSDVLHYSYLYYLYGSADGRGMLHFQLYRRRINEVHEQL